jgi:hypothetical protein
MLVGAVVACGRKPVLEGGGDQKTTPVITVCQLFQHLERYPGQTVRMRGIYWYGLRQSCPGKFVTGAQEWPYALDVVRATMHDRDWDELDRLTMTLAHTAWRGEIWVTVTGRIETGYVKQGQMLLQGYGHLAAYPVELTGTDVSDVSAQQTPPTYDYGRLLHGAE